jgi:alpha-glucosidase
VTVKPKPVAVLNAPVAASDGVALSVSVKPVLDELPVYARGGAILPMAPLTQSTDETPQGPLTLRVYAGDDCRGTLYTDDGTSFAYKQGQYLRVSFSCHMDAGRMVLTIGKHEGSYPAWWKDVRVEVYGWRGANGRASVAGQVMQETPLTNGFAFTMPENGQGETITLE